MQDAHSEVIIVMMVINVMIMMLSVMSSPLLKMSMALRYLFERMASLYDYDDDDIENHVDMVRHIFQSICWL